MYSAGGIGSLRKAMVCRTLLRQRGGVFTVYKKGTVGNNLQASGSWCKRELRRFKSSLQKSTNVSRETFSTELLANAR
jgi:hypothetical protein